MGRESESIARRSLEGRWGEGADEAGLTIARQLAEVSQLLVGAGDVDRTLALTCRLAADHIPGCEGAGAVLSNKGSMRPVGATGEVARVADELQIRLREGPSVEAIRSGGRIRVDDLRVDARWPTFGPAAVDATGALSILSCCLRAGGRTMGALDLYSSKAAAFDEGSKTSDLGLVFASHASVALAGAQALEGLTTALESRETISVAIGILMARQRLTRAQAFDVLRRASQRENIKLREIAARIAGDVEDVLEPDRDPPAGADSRVERPL